MDPASAILGFISFGFTVFEKVDEIIRVIKGAPEQLQSLQESCSMTKLLLRQIDKASECGLYESMDLSDDGIFQHVREKAQGCLQNVDAAIQKITTHMKRGSVVGGTYRMSAVHRWKWYFKKGELDDVSNKLRRLQEALTSMLEITQSNYLEYIAMGVNKLRNHDVSQSIDTASDDSSIATRDTQVEILRCLPGCECRCHELESNLIPTSLSTYLGRLLIPQRLLLAPWFTWACCNVQTCRGDIQTPVRVKWLLPPGPFSIHLRLSLSTLWLDLSIDMQRVSPDDDPVYDLV